MKEEAEFFKKVKKGFNITLNTKIKGLEINQILFKEIETNWIN